MRPNKVLFALAAVFFVLIGCATNHELRPLQALPSTATLGQPADPDHFVFYVFGDNRPAKKSDPPTPTIQQIADALTAAKPDLALSCGDLIAGKEPDDKSKILAEYQAILDIFNATGVPLYNAPGNHGRTHVAGNSGARLRKRWTRRAAQQTQCAAGQGGDSP